MQFRNSQAADVGVAMIVAIWPDFNCARVSRKTAYSDADDSEHFSRSPPRYLSEKPIRTPEMTLAGFAVHAHYSASLQSCSTQDLEGAR